MSSKEKADIYCPRCTWRPSAEDRWSCLPACGTVWNTFWTRGVCPGCARQWRDTQCLDCQRYSPHERWYHDREPAEHECETQDASQDAKASG